MHAVARPVRPLWEWWRIGLCLLGLLVWLACSVLQPRLYPDVHWLGGAELGLCSLVAAFLVLTGAPRREHPAQPSRRPLVRVLRALAHPIPAAVINCIVLILVFSTGAYDRAAASPLGWPVLMAFVWAMGLWADVGVLVPGLLPSLGPGLQVLWATVAGLVDELPGIFVMTLHHHDAGVAMLVVEQPIILPVLGVLMARWVRHDREQAFFIDQQLDAEERARQSGA